MPNSTAASRADTFTAQYPAIPAATARRVEVIAERPAMSLYVP